MPRTHARWTTQLRQDDGVTLVELLVVVFLAGIIGAVTLTAVTRVMAGYAKVTNDTSGLTDVRTVQERMSRDLRQARGIDSTANASQLSIWIDKNSDYVKTNDEVITWKTLDAAGGRKNVIRIDGLSGRSVVVGKTLVSKTVFSYNSGTAASSNVVLVDLQYNAKIGKVNKTKHVDFSITLRNFG